MSVTAKLDRNQAAEFLAGLRRDISAARLRVTLDEKLGRDTPLPVKKLAALPEPPSIEAETEPVAEDQVVTSVAAATAVFVTNRDPRSDLEAFIANFEESGSTGIVFPMYLKRPHAGSFPETSAAHGAHQAQSGTALP